MTSVEQPRVDLRGRVALVTGASRGIGAALAKRLGAAGAAVAVVARTINEGSSTEPGSIERTVAEIRASGGIAQGIQADLAAAVDRERAVAEAVAAFGPIEVLVNNAVNVKLAPTIDYRSADFDAAEAVMLRAPLHLTQLVLPSMVASGTGALLNISSAAAVHPPGPPYDAAWASSGNTVYGLLKAALERLTTGVAAEVHHAGVAVNALAPSGLVDRPEDEGRHRIPPELMPDWLEYERVEHFVEAAVILCDPVTPGRATGRVVSSSELLRELGHLTAS